MDGDDKEDKEEGDAGRDDDRSRSPRLRRHHESFDPNEATDLLNSTQAWLWESRPWSLR